jgi:hypothetical protein
VVRFVDNSLSFNQLNISRADIPCLLENGVGEAARSTQPVILYISLNIAPPNLYNSPPSMPTADVDFPTEKATIPRRTQPPSPEHPMPLSHHQPVEAGNSMPPKNPRLALKRADQAMKRMDRSNTWQGAVGRIKWVMDALGPIAEVRVIPFDVLSWAKFHTQHFPPAKMAHGLLLAIPKARPFVSFFRTRR